MSSGERTAQSQSDSATRGLTGHVACCMVSGACCMLHVAFRMLHVAWCPAHVACYMLYVAWCSLHVALCALHVACCTLQAACCTVSTACCTLRYWLCRCGARTGMRRSTSTRTTSCDTLVRARHSPVAADSAHRAPLRSGGMPRTACASEHTTVTHATDSLRQPTRSGRRAACRVAAPLVGMHEALMQWWTVA